MFFQEGVGSLKGPENLETAADKQKLPGKVVNFISFFLVEFL
jgi:hypothetical protein